jgi:hypothetical protein
MSSSRLLTAGNFLLKCTYLVQPTTVSRMIRIARDVDFTDALSEITSAYDEDHIVDTEWSVAYFDATMGLRKALLTDDDWSECLRNATAKRQKFIYLFCSANELPPVTATATQRPKTPFKVTVVDPKQPPLLSKIPVAIKSRLPVHVIGTKSRQTTVMRVDSNLSQRDPYEDKTVTYLTLPRMAPHITNGYATGYVSPNAPPLFGQHEPQRQIFNYQALPLNQFGYGVAYGAGLPIQLPAVSSFMPVVDNQYQWRPEPAALSGRPFKSHAPRSTYA